METKELRIGNLIHRKDFSENDYTEVTADLLAADILYIYEPILLNKELMLKAGFKLDIMDGVWGKNINGYYFAIWDKCGNCPYRFSLSPTEVIDVKYVHKLQNLCFELTNEELIFKP